MATNLTYNRTNGLTVANKITELISGYECTHPFVLIKMYSPLSRKLTPSLLCDYTLKGSAKHRGGTQGGELI